MSGIDVCLVKTLRGPEVVSVRLGHRLLDAYLEFVAARARPNTLLAVAYDLSVFFTEIAKEPAEVVSADVLAFITAQRAPQRGPGVVRLEDGEAGLSARTIKRRLASVAGLSGHPRGAIHHPVGGSQAREMAYPHMALVRTNSGIRLAWPKSREHRR